MSGKRWWESPWLVAGFVVFASPVAVILLDDWAAVRKAFAVLLVVLILAAASWLLVVLHRDDQRKQETHEEDLVRIREETAKTGRKGPKPGRQKPKNSEWRSVGRRPPSSCGAMSPAS